MSLAEKVVRQAISWAVTVMVPVILIMTAVRLLLTPAFLQAEYHSPGFPPDTYGFTLQDRLHWSQVSWDYMLNDRGIDFLANQRLADGQPLYNERELSHMLDVKNLVQPLLKIWEVCLGLTVGLGLAAWGARWSADYRRGLSRGGWLTVGLIVAVLIAIALSFNTFFTDFHRVFFKGDTWLFLYSDTLIRLFPLRFWRDAFILGGVITLVGGAGLGYFAHPKVAAPNTPVKAATQVKKPE